ncbi:MAG: RlmE family RNA methyltransferase [Rickettsiaceae bacterium]
MLEQNHRNKHTKLKRIKKIKPSSQKWLLRQLNDPYVQMAKKSKYRSRAAYKLIDINTKFKLFKPDLRIIDLGSAPGSWSQVALELSKNAKIIAIDLLEIHPIESVNILQGDFTQDETKLRIKNILDETQLVDVVMSDMAANTTGHKMTDHIRTMDLCEHAYEFSISVLKPGGHFISKIFRGGTQNTLLDRIKKQFKITKHFKPQSSRKDSVEEYLIAMHKY